MYLSLEESGDHMASPAARMRTVLGIDAAWTPRQPSGVALAMETLAGWKIVAVESSYERFQMLAETKVAPDVRPSGSVPDVPVLLRSAERLAGRRVDLVAIDMPLSHAPIIGRRKSDDAVSCAYGAKQCGTHSPSAERPGQISDKLKQDFQQSGYPLGTLSVRCPALIEVYPHPALVELANASKRLPYKAAKIRKYWPNVAPEERRSRLFVQWRGIVQLLDLEVMRVADVIPELDATAKGVVLKAYEDMLDAVVCAWVGICVLEGRAKPFGDNQSAIWVPRLRDPG
jgi:predicted RNase H-like nuclease